jgi:hypothetical protein
LNAGIGLYGLSRIYTRPFRLVNSRPLSFLSKTHTLKGGKGFFFSGLVNELITESIPCGGIRLRRITDCSWGLQKEGFIVRDNRGRIKTIIFGKKRST